MEPYQNFTLQHFGAIAVFLVISYLIISGSSGLNREKQKVAFFIVSLVPFLALVSRMVLDHYHRGLNLREDLPLHLCRTLAFLAPLVVQIGNKRMLEIFVYIALAGTVNAMITADPGYGFPHYEYFLYWIYHGGILLVAVYALIVSKISLSIQGAWQSFLGVNLFFLIVHGVNELLSSNYMYSRHKPQVNTLLDHLGEWPYYLFWIELIALVMLGVVYLFERYIIRKLRRPG